MGETSIKGTEAVATRISKALGAAALAALACLPVAQAAAEGAGQNSPFISTQNTRTIQGEQYIPGIWVDPDGCEHWVMDDGVEGYMSPHVDRKGIPVCRRANTCGVMNTDQFFATDSSKLSHHAQAQIANFFRSSTAVGFVIAGHTDSRASDAYNMKLSYNRALAVARVAASVGANITDVRGYGERMPVASNATHDGMARNRRVEIICFQ
jgi:outer membrane protein OmpA-like peptidoglycan-associated protein